MVCETEEQNNTHIAHGMVDTDSVSRDEDAMMGSWGSSAIIALRCVAQAERVYRGRNGMDERWARLATRDNPRTASMMS